MPGDAKKAIVVFFILALMFVLFLTPISTVFIYPYIRFHINLALAKSGDADAQAKVGRVYARGKCAFQWPVPCNGNEGEKWLLSSAEQGNVLGQAYLGFAYSSDLGIKTDPEKAVKWLRAAAEQNDRGSQQWLGWLYAKARIDEPPIGAIKLPKQNYEEAYFWLSISTPKTYLICIHESFFRKRCVNEPNKYALEAVERAKGKLTTQQKSRVDKRIAEWRRDHPSP